VDDRSPDAEFDPGFLPERTLEQLPAPAPSLELLAVVEHTHPVRTRRPRRTWLGITLVSLACAASLLTWAIGLRRDLGSIPPAPLVLFTMASLTSFGAHLAAALIPAAGQVLAPGHRSARVSILLSIIAVPLGLLVGVHVHGDLPEAVVHTRRSWSNGFACLASGFSVAAVPATLGLLALRRIIPMGAWRPALAVGAAAGVLAGLALQFHCPIPQLAHVGSAHGAAMVLPGLVLALLGTRILSR
jgi:hypothetical protein